MASNRRTGARSSAERRATSPVRYGRRPRHGPRDWARDWRLGWRLAPTGGGFEVNLDAIRRETANDPDAEHGIMLRSVARW